MAGALLAPLAGAAYVADAGYGAGGVRPLEPLAGVNQSLVASADDAQGRLVAVGSIERGGRRDLLVARFLEDGRLDAAFGLDGIVEIDAGGADEGLAVAIQPDGRIVVAGGRDGCALLVRLLDDGALDASFGANGFLRVALLAGSAGRLIDVAIDPQGRVVALGSLAAGGGAQSAAHPYLVRVGADGRLDASFDNDGVRVLREVQARAGALDFDAAGRAVVVGYWDAEYLLLAVDAAGALDAAFGDGGIARVAVGANALAADLLAVPGALYVAGVNGVALVKLDGAGRRDAGFGVGGVAAAPLPINVWSLAALADGSVAVAGSCKAGASDGMLIARFSALGAYSPVLCEVNAAIGGFAEVRGLRTHGGADLHGVVVRFESGRVDAAVVRYVEQAAPLPAKCRKARYARKNPQVCGPR